MQTKKKKILIVGLGAIGQILACHLKAAGNNIYGIDVRKDCVEAIRENAINIEGLTSLKANLDEVHTRLDELAEKNFDYVVITVKTPYMPEVVSSIMEQFNGDFKVISMQNGIDNEEYLAAHFGRERVLRFVINFAGNIIAPGRVKMTFFHKPNYVGCLCGTKACDHSKNFADVMTDAGLETGPSEDIKKFAWRKTILVAGLAPLSAILGMTMADVMAMEETRYLVKLLLEEAIGVASAKGYEFGGEFFEQCMQYLSTAGPHKPSMLIDIENGSPTEIEYINGKISHYGNQNDIPVPLNTYLTILVKAREQLGIKNKNNRK